MEGRDEWYSTHGGAGNSETLPGIFPDGYIQKGVNVETGEVNDKIIDPFQRVVAVLGLGLGEDKHKVPTDYIMDATNVRLREVVLVIKYLNAG